MEAALPAASSSSLLGRVFAPSRGASASNASRVAAGLVFVVAGVVKLAFENQGVLRFAKIGLAPELAYLVSVLEIAGGLAFVVGAGVRPAALVLAVDMMVAVVTTKLPLLVGPGPEPVAAAPKMGILAFAYQARLDLLLLAIACGVLVAGAGPRSIDARIAARLGDAEGR